MTETLPNRSVFFAAIILIFVGASSLVTLVIGLFCDALCLDPTILGLPLGYGILVGHETSRHVARFGAGCLLVILVVGFSLALAYYLNGWERELVTCSAHFSTALVTLASLLVFCGLQKERAAGWFFAPRASGFARNCTLTVGLLAIALTIDQHLESQEYKSQIERSFLIQTRIKLVDAEDGTGISSVSMPSQILTSQREGLAKLTYATRATRDGIEIHVNGILVQPTKLTFGADGYRNADVMLDRKTKGVIRLNMVRGETEPSDPPEPRSVVL